MTNNDFFPRLVSSPFFKYLLSTQESLSTYRYVPTYTEQIQGFFFLIVQDLLTT